jgi:hypothetical protein
MAEFFKKLIEEIHSRSLWQVTLVYVGGAWAMLGHMDIVVEIGFPHWVFEAAAIILVVGYVVVLGIAALPRVMKRVAPKKVAEAGQEYGGDFLLPADSDLPLGLEEPESVRLGPSGEAIPEELRSRLRALLRQARRGEISKEDLARIMVEENISEDELFGGPALARQPPRVEMALPSGVWLPSRRGVLASLAVLLAVVLVLWGPSVLGRLVPAGPIGNGSPVIPLVLVALWPIMVIVAYSFVRRRTAA